MDKISTLNTIKNVFAALGAKTSDDNYGVALLDKTTAEPKGLMGMSDLASVLGAIKGDYAIHSLSEQDNLKTCGIFFINGSSGSAFETDDAALVVFDKFYTNGNSVIQLKMTKNNGMKYRWFHGNSWDAWI